MTLVSAFIVALLCHYSARREQRGGLSAFLRTILWNTGLSPLAAMLGSPDAVANRPELIVGYVLSGAFWGAALGGIAAQGVGPRKTNSESGEEDNLGPTGTNESVQGSSESSRVCLDTSPVEVRAKEKGNEKIALPRHPDGDREVLSLLELCDLPGITTEQVQSFLDLRVNVNATDSYGQTPLHRASKSSRDPAVLALLIKAGADVNARDKDDGATPLQWASIHNPNPDILAILIRAGADANERDDDGYTPLHCAAAHNENPAVVTFLVSAGADPNTKSRYGETPLDWTDEEMPKKAEILLAAGGSLGEDL